MAKEIKIVGKKANGQNIAEPEGGKRTRVGKDETVKFTFAPGATQQTISFEKHPFDKTPAYGLELKVVGPKGVYPYSCSLVIGGESFTKESGGEMEVISG
jgi:hypothetical protein